MAFSQPQSGWTAMSILPNPELFGHAHNVISGVAGGFPAAAPAVLPTTTAPVAPPITNPYQNLRQAIMPTSQQQQQLTSPSPLQAVAAVSKQLQESPWTPKPTEQPNNFVNPDTGQPQTKSAQPKTNGWTSPLPSSSLPSI